MAIFFFFFCRGRVYRVRLIRQSLSTRIPLTLLSTYIYQRLYCNCHLAWFVNWKRLGASSLAFTYILSFSWIFLRLLMGNLVFFFFPYWASFKRSRLFLIKINSLVFLVLCIQFIRKKNYSTKLLSIAVTYGCLWDLNQKKKIGQHRNGTEELDKVSIHLFFYKRNISILSVVQWGFLLSYPLTSFI